MSSLCIKVWLIFLKHYLGLKGQMPSSVLREVCDYLTSFLHLPYLSHDCQLLCVLSLPTLTKQVYSNLTIMQYSLSLVDSASLFFLEGRTSKKNAPCLVHLDVFQLIRLTQMDQSRLFPGVASLNGYVYVFAGKTTACECYGFYNSQWRTIADFPNAAARISTCIHSDTVYLAAERHIDLFTYYISRNSFERIGIKLPFRGQFFCVGPGEFVVFDHYTSYSLRINEKKGEASEKTDGVLYQLRDWERGGEPVNAMASSLSHVERGPLVYVLLDSLCRYEGDQLCTLDTLRKKLRIQSFAK